MSSQSWGWSVASLLFAGVIPGCGGSTSGTLGSGRVVSAESDGISLSTSLGKDTATIETAGKKIVIQPARLLIDDQPVALLNAKALNVQVTVKHGAVTLVADGLTVVKDLK